MVNVGVMVGVEVAVAVCVGEGDAVTVVVGLGAASTVSPQAVNSKVVPRSRTGIVSDKLLVQFPDDAQAFQREPGRDDVDHIRLFGDDFSQSARCDDFHIASQLGPKSCHHALDHAHVPEQ